MFLKSLAETHGNPRLDPDAPTFDKATFGDPKDWRLVVVRPRIDKKFHELRLVYQAVKAPEPVFAMFRVRPVEDLPRRCRPRPRPRTTRSSPRLFWKPLPHRRRQGPAAKFRKDPKAHGAAVAAFVQAA
jgi:hypothetical protein